MRIDPGGEDRPAVPAVPSAPSVTEEMVGAAGAREFAGTARFHVRRLLGAGGMGVVYEVFDNERRLPVALKVLGLRGAEALLRFKNEFRGLRDVRHPNLVKLGELFEDGGSWFYTMELVDGVDFLQYVRAAEAARTAAPEPAPTTATLRDQPSVDDRSALEPNGAGSVAAAPRFDEPRLRGAFVQLARGLAALHAADKVHRDVKPSNVLVTAEGRVVILDFGIVADLAPDDPDDLCRVMGTAAYIAPEQAAGRPVSPAADWYSAGVVLYQALTGRRPFAGGSGDLVARKQRLDPDPPSALVAELPGDLERLCVDLLEREPSRRPDGSQVLERLLASRAPVALPVTLPVRRRLFHGRRRELDHLLAAFEDTHHGRAVTVLVQGDSGVGKSALMARFATELAAWEPRALVLAGRCHERESVRHQAIDAIVDALSRHLVHLRRDEADAVVPPGGSLLPQLFPVLGRVEVIAAAPAVVRALDPQETRRRAFAALRELLRRLAWRQPVVLCIDDLQWADADGLRLLAEILRPPDEPPVFVIATTRSELELERASARRQPGADPRASEPWDGDVRRVSLGAMDAEDARQLARRLLEETDAGAQEVVRLTEAITEEAEGHPMFIAELVRWRHELEDAGRLQLNDALRARIARLDPDGARLLELVAVAGGPIEQAVVAEAMAVEFAVLARVTEALEAEHLVRIDGARLSDSIEPYHDRVREAVEARLAPDARAARHLSLARALEASGSPDPEVLAAHFTGAGQHAQAARCAVVAAEHAAAALAFDRAARLYRVALSACRDEDRRGLLVKLGDALVGSGRGGDAAQAFLEAAAIGAGDDALDLRRRAAEHLLRSGHTDDGLAILRTVLADVGLTLPRTSKRALSSFLFGAARLRIRGTRFRERPASSIPAEQLQRVDVCRSAASGLGMIDVIRGGDFQLRHLWRALQAGEPERVAMALAYHSILIASAGGAGRRQADKLDAQAIALAERVGSPEALALSAMTRGVAAAEYGEWRRCLSLCDQAEQIFRERCNGMEWELATGQLFSTVALFYLGELVELGRRVPALMVEADARGDVYAMTNMRVGFPNAVWLVQDDVERARDESTRAMSRWSSAGYHTQHFSYLLSRGHQRLYVGDGAGALREVEADWPALSGSMLLRIQIIRVPTVHLRARAALAVAAASRPSTAQLAAIDRDARRLEAERMPWVTPLAGLVKAAAAALRGDAAAALAGLTKVDAQFAAADMPVYAAAARRQRGRLLGGDEGRAMVAAADTWMRDHGVRDPVRMAGMLAPGFAAPP